MNLRLFQELMELNIAFEQVIRGLQRMEKVRLFRHSPCFTCRCGKRESGSEPAVLR